MAHGDYSCCLICDAKMSYGSEETKETACTDCVDTMFETGVHINTPSRLIKQIKSLKKSDALKFLYLIGYEPCYYNNKVDTYLQKIGLVTKKASDGKWGKRLKKLPTPPIKEQKG